MLVVVDLVLVLILVVVVRVRILLVVGSGASAGRGIAWRGATINCSRAYGSRAFSAQYLAHALQAVPSFIRRAVTGACVCVCVCVCGCVCARTRACVWRVAVVLLVLRSGRALCPPIGVHASR